MEVKILNMCTLSNTFPAMPEKVLSREKYINLIDEQFANHKILCIEGQEGVGISTTFEVS